MSGQGRGTAAEAKQRAELVDKYEAVCLFFNMARIYALEYSSVIRKLETRSHIWKRQSTREQET